MTETVAQGQLRAFVAFAKLIGEFRDQRRAEHYASIGVPLPARKARDYAPYYSCGERLPRKRATNGVPVDDAAWWLWLCADLCRDAADDFDHESRRGWTIVCRLLGLGWNDRARALADVYNYSASEAAPHWAPYLSAPDHRYVGWVYAAEVVGEPEIVKVGFSRKPVVRAEQLSRIEGRPVRLISARPGTMLHEWALHQHILRRVKPEWYPRERVPSWLLGEASPLAEVA